jgi:hypothetical protein
LVGRRIEPVAVGALLPHVYTLSCSV